MLPGNSNWFEWQWPTSGDFEGCILAQSISNLGPWTTFTPTQLEKLQKREIEKPNPNISTPSNSERMYHGNYFDSLPIASQNFPFALFHLQFCQFYSFHILSCNRIVLVINEILLDVKEVYPLQIGWALKENQKFSKKEAGKRMTNQVRALLEGYFMAGNADKSNRYTAQDMQRELEKCAQEGEIDKDNVPKVTTIQNWISKTTREHREKAATRVLNYNNL
ncbi:unnamed protein product [Rhizophagus irregularis]|nr:unnamed protein product [Rhizophagus irregularis]